MSTLKLRAFNGKKGYMYEGWNIIGYRTDGNCPKCHDDIIRKMKKRVSGCWAHKEMCVVCDHVYKRYYKKLTITKYLI